MNINRVVITGNLTADPEVRGTDENVCRLRIACNTRRKQEDGSWGDKANYFDVVLFGAQVGPVRRYLSKGSPVAVDGRLDWSEWEVEGAKRQSVQIIADNIQFLGRSEEAGGGESTDRPTPRRDENEDIPF